LSNNTIVPSWDRPTVFVEGKTIYNVITELLDHRKLLGWGVGFRFVGGIMGGFGLRKLS
jgi:hypothetical protein